MLFNTKLDHQVMDYNYIGRYFHWRDAEHATFFKCPSVTSERWEKRISGNHEQGIDCDSDIIYEVGDEEVVQFWQSCCIYYPLRVLYDKGSFFMWVEVGVGIWAPCRHEPKLVYAMNKKKDRYDRENQETIG
jgi:hypothetical protein